jgi:hypothetical protein
VGELLPGRPVTVAAVEDLDQAGEIDNNRCENAIRPFVTERKS